jgi:hypothetical protein
VVCNIVDPGSGRRIFYSVWKEKNFRTNTNTSVRKKSSKREYRFIKNDATGNIDVTNDHIETLKTFVHDTLSKKNTLFETKLQFACVIKEHILPTSTTKNT